VCWCVWTNGWPEDAKRDQFQGLISPNEVNTEGSVRLQAQARSEGTCLEFTHLWQWQSTITGAPSLHARVLVLYLSPQTVASLHPLYTSPDPSISSMSSSSTCSGSSGCHPAAQVINPADHLPRREARRPASFPRATPYPAPKRHLSAHRSERTPSKSPPTLRGSR
jgi:hypothetical protein